ncbi:response regulator transcription factor [Cohnella fermenti]|uniref:Response regulator n=1 Tax=Cohnella fermenti TaxID=2565925 RepID=A0A4V3WFL6_9BACL|nr:response regulator [Cohnella fermenti]THF80762.1 response regulator [Cohnella fermenti]
MNILIVDDEPLIRESAANHLKKAGAHRIYEAADGLEGLQAIGALRPDLVIADIRMPGMDGLELLAALKQRNDDTLFVLLTGYDRFEYVQSALHLGAFSYLLKPFAEEQFTELLAKVRETLERQNRAREAQLRQSIRLHQGTVWMRRRLAEDLVSRRLGNETAIRKRLAELELGTRFERGAHCIIIIALDRYRILSGSLPSDQIALIRYGVENIAMEVLERRSVDALAFDTEDGQGLILSYAPSPGGKSADTDTDADADADVNANDEMARLAAWAADIQECIRRYWRQEVTIGISPPFRALTQSAEACEAAKQALLQRLVRGGASIYLSEPGAMPKEPFKGIGFRVEQDMLAAFERFDTEAAQSIIQSLYEPFISYEYVDQASLLKLNFQLILLIFKIVERWNLEPTKLLGDELALYEEINGMSRIETIKQTFSEWIDRCFEAIRREKDKGSNRIIDKAISYIHEHYSEDVSLEMVAEQIPVSPTYLSSLFKREHNENFVEYVSNYRIEKAKLMLREGRRKIHEVAVLTGFGNVKYFYKVFKKKTGMRPSEYKDL